MTEKLKQKRPPRKPFWPLLLILSIVILNQVLRQLLSRWYWLYLPSTVILHPDQLIQEFHRVIVYGALFLVVLILLVLIAAKTFKQNRFNLAATFILMPIAIMIAWGNLAQNINYRPYELRSETTIEDVTYYVGTLRTSDIENSNFYLTHFIYVCELGNLCSELTQLGSISSNASIDETNFPPPTIEVGGNNRAIYGSVRDNSVVIGELGFEEGLTLPTATISAENAAQMGTLLDIVTNEASALWSPDGDYLLRNDVYRPNPTLIYRLPTMEVAPDMLIVNGKAVRVDNLTFSADGKRVAGFTSGNNFWLWDWETHELLYTQSMPYTEAAYPNPDGSIIALIAKQPNVTLYDVASQSEIARFDNQLDTYWSHNASYSPDGRYVATISQYLRLWDTETGTAIPLDIPVSFDGGCAVDFSSDSRFMAATETDIGRIYVFDVATGEQLYSVSSGAPGNVCGLDFSPDGKLLATGNSLGRLQVWDLESGERIANIQAHDRVIISTQFHPSGTMILTSGHDQHLRVWGVPD